MRVTEDDLLKDAAEQALNDQYNRQVSAFYSDAHSKAAAVRKLYDENAIRELFEDE